MAAAVLIKHTLLIVLVCLVYDAHARPDSRRRSNRYDRCRKDLERCVGTGRGYACMNGGYDVECRGRNVICDGRIDCPWGEDEKFCNRPTIRPTSTTYTTTTIARTTTTTKTSTTTTTRTNSVTSTSTTTSHTTSTSVTTTTSTPSVSLASSSVWFATTITSTLTESFSAVIARNSGDMITGGSTCSFVTKAAADNVAAGDYILVTTTTESILIVEVSATCSATTATVN
ncbi:integumentary mucin C.1-like [Mercenaria mercenaria]|uniref:integumentary mucin C.1-like n=1 Tax=Mercenaria mercenaria TaxID=6596 RepID=UPI001E1E1232|nr:integumentary mucin C.1-like [Mercenaria mercenaria]